MSKLLNFLGLYTFQDLTKQKEIVKEIGYKEGYKKGYTNAMEQKILASEALTEKEQESLTKIFVSFGIEICYDVRIGGLRLRKSNRIINN